MIAAVKSFFMTGWGAVAGAVSNFFGRATSITDITDIDQIS